MRAFSKGAESESVTQIVRIDRHGYPACDFLDYSQAPKRVDLRRQGQCPVTGRPNSLLALMTCPSCKAENDDTADNCLRCGKGLFVLTLGAVLNGRYEIVGSLGKGGMGMVYKALDRELEETVAIKILRLEAAATAERKRPVSPAGVDGTGRQVWRAAGPIAG